MRDTAIRPLDAVEAIVAIAVFLGGLWLISPFYQPDASVSSMILNGESIVPRVLGAFQTVISGFLLFALARPRLKSREVIRRGAAFSIFMLYIFYGAASVILFGLDRVTWIITFSLALISGVIYLRLKWEANGNARN